MPIRQVCGLDVHKDSIFACILNENGVIYQEKFGVLTTELEQLLAVLQQYDVGEVCMESTSIYWMPVWRVLEPYVELKLVNPYFIKQLPGKKSDVKDAEWIATCLLKDLISGSYVPGDLIQQLRQYDRRISDLDREIVRKLGKMDAALQRCNIRISNYVSNTDTKGYKEVVRLITEGVTDPEELSKAIHGKLANRAGHNVIVAALTSVFNESDIDMLRQLRDEVELARSHKDECQSKMDAICQKYFPRQFAHLVSWCGLKPRNEESAGKIKARSITHGNKFLRKTLIECAWAASKTQGCFYSKFSYHQCVVRRKNKMKVQVAIARKLLTAVWFVLHDDVAYRDYTPDIVPAAQ